MTNSITILESPQKIQLKKLGELAKMVVVNIIIGVAVAVPVALISGAIIGMIQNDPESAE